MSERPHKKNHQPPGTLPNRVWRFPFARRPGRNRPAKNYDAVRRVWVRGVSATPEGANP